jgi:predicted aspartyl protease
MSIIKLPLLYEGSQGEKHLYTLFDTGATFSCISPESAEGLGNSEKLYRPMEVATAAVGVYLKITHRISVDFYINDVRLSDEFYIIPSLSEDAILGVNTFQKWRIKLDFEHDTVIVERTSPVQRLRRLC